MVHRCVDGRRFGERVLIKDEPRAASTRVTSKTLVCFCMAHEVFKKIMTECIKLLQELLRSFDRQELTEAAQAL